MKNHGKSDASWKRWDVDENADIVISILEQLGVEKCNLVGWSMGSAVALSISRKKEKLINKMVLITPFSWLGGAVYKDKPLFKAFVAKPRQCWPKPIGRTSIFAAAFTVSKNRVLFRY